MKEFPWPVFACLGILVLSSLALSAGPDLARAADPGSAAVKFAGAAALALAVTALGLIVSRRTGFRTPLLDRLFSKRREPIPAARWMAESIGPGAAVGAIGLAAMKLLFLTANPAWRAAWAEEGARPIGTRLALCFEAAVQEEVLYRLLFLSLFVWILSRFLKREASSPVLFSAANAGSALLFGLAHLAKPFPLGTAQIAGIVLVNGTAALVFGWLYRRRGLESALAAHFTADFILRVAGHAMI